MTRSVTAGNEEPEPYRRCGTLAANSRYMSGCRCADCRAAHRDANRRHRRSWQRVVDFDSLPCECWCQTDIVLVSRRDVLALRTGSCGRPGCEEVA